jgi:hypothetical protein
MISQNRIGSGAPELKLRIVSNPYLGIISGFVQNPRLPHVRIARFASKPPWHSGSGGRVNISAIVAPSD